MPFRTFRSIAVQSFFRALSVNLLRSLFFVGDMGAWASTGLPGVEDELAVLLPLRELERWMVSLRMSSRLTLRSENMGATDVSICSVNFDEAMATMFGGF
ncbi:hypothetical protein P152DRAFT_15596 [Eremomyces bilateralis CBS 781.70]|uniref:Uncharacterized protein n=1 Tax=Eremomyces bilateralis CBS 781.70 TaxID=1392243 RepID=A0A6G1GHF4_9PEZI|nr:uncharacterized protein P152DRAFT_15596 [Eremomyces bilateralis CBS 781.70]KAF1817331.1 hypothetical protein P152DRAFT_15596 [Eremomyces bilateralis CBS 781.70]